MTEDVASDLPPNDENIAVKTLDVPSLEPPETRLGNSWALRDRIAEMVRNDVDRAKKRAAIQNWIDGGARPFSASKLRALGQGNRANFNPRTGEGQIATAVTPYYGLVFNNTRFANIQCSYGENPQRRSFFGTNLSISFHELLKAWSAFDYHMQLKQAQLVQHGIGIPMYRDNENWQWESCKIGNFLVPDKTPALIEKLEEATYFYSISPVDLFKLVDRASANDLGWFVERVKAIIVKRAPQKITAQNVLGGMWSESWAESLRRGDVMWNSDDAQIKLAGYLIKEFSGKISHCLMVDSGEAATPDTTESDALLLYKKVDDFDSFAQVVLPFFFDCGGVQGDWHATKGLGPKIMDNTVADARLLMGLIDGARNGSALILEAQDAQSEQISQMIEIAGAIVTPAGLKLQQNRLADSLQGPMTVRRELENINQTNNGVFLQRMALDNQEGTLGQAQMNARQSQQLTGGAQDRYCKSLDRLYSEMARRAALMGIKIYKRLHPGDEVPPQDYTAPESLTDSERGAYYFIRRAVERGTPLEACDPKWFCSVEANRGIGGGSPAAMDISTQEGMTMLPTLKERGRNEVIRMRLAFLYGQQNVDAIEPPFDEAEMPNDHAALATLENNALRMKGGEVLMTPLQDPVIHFQYHFGDAADHVQQFKDGQADPMELLVHLHQAGPHMKAHLNMIAGDPSRKDQFKNMEAHWLQLSKFTDQLTQQMIEHMQSQQAEQQPPAPDPEMVAAVMKAKGELGIKQFVAQGKLAIQAETQRAKNRLADLDQAHAMRLKNREIALAPTPQAGQIAA